MADDVAAISGDSVEAFAEHQQNEGTAQQELHRLLAGIQLITRADLSLAEKTDALGELSELIQPKHSFRESRQTLVKIAAERGAAQAAVSCVELGDTDLSEAASIFLTNLAFDSNQGACAVLSVFDRAVKHFRHLFDGRLSQDNLDHLNTAILLCANIAASCPSSHLCLLPLVQPMCLRLISPSPSTVTNDKLRGDAILLLANLSLTVGDELRELGVSEMLLNAVLDSTISSLGKSVSESVVVFLHDGRKCAEIDRLIETDVISDYCVPLMQQTLNGHPFRGMYPALVYSARLFWMLARTPEYARTLADNRQAVQLLLEATQPQEATLAASCDLEGRLLALEALRALCSLGLWPPSDTSGTCHRFIQQELPALMSNDHQGIRASAAGIWVMLNPEPVEQLLIIGGRLDGKGDLPLLLWRRIVLAFLFPSLAGEQRFA